MSASDSICDQLVAVTRSTGPSFFEAWERVGPDYRLKATGETYSRAYANMVLQEVHPGADLEVWP